MPNPKSLNDSRPNLYKVMVRFMQGEDMCNACYFVWGKNEVEANKVVTSNPPYAIISTEHIDTTETITDYHSGNPDLNPPSFLSRRQKRRRAQVERENVY